MRHRAALNLPNTWSNKMSTIHRSLFSRAAVIAVSAALLSSSIAKPGPQDITGGASVLLASSDVEAKLGKGIFSSPQNVAHTTKHLEKKTVARTSFAAHARQTSSSGGQQTARNEGRRTRPSESRTEERPARPGESPGSTRPS